MKDRLVTAAIIPAILDLAIKNRVQADKIFSNANVDPAVVNQSGTFISVTQLLQLLDSAYEEVNRQSFGLLLGDSIHYHSLDLVGQLVATSSTVEQALDALFRFKDLVLPYTTFDLRVEGENAILVFAVDKFVVKQNWPLHHEIIAAATHSIAKALVPGGLPLVKVCFAHTQPEYLADYHRIFDAPIVFENAFNALVFRHQLLQEKLLTAYPEYHQGVKILAKEKLKSIESYESLSNKVTHYINFNLGLKPTLLEDVAQNFSMTPRTLQRKLKLEFTSFVQLRDACRHRRALRDLADPKIDIDSLAELLGFSDTSNFYHAFRRWQGVSPGEYRRKVLQNDDRDR